MEAAIVSGNGTETGQIIATTVGGRNGQPKQVIWLPWLNAFAFYGLFNLIFLHVGPVWYRSPTALLILHFMGCLNSLVFM
jgi:hypothetical protein